MTQMMRCGHLMHTHTHTHTHTLSIVPPQPVADQPFTFETELDDLPKEKLKCM